MSPGRRTNRQNLRSCQRTILLYSFYKISQRKIRVCKYSLFNRVHAIHRPRTENSATAASSLSRNSVPDAAFRAIYCVKSPDWSLGHLLFHCEYPALAAPGKGFNTVIGKHLPENSTARAESNPTVSNTWPAAICVNRDSSSVTGGIFALPFEERRVDCPGRAHPRRVLTAYP